MKVTSVESFSGWVSWCNWYFVRVETDEGLVGWGEGSLHGPLGAVDAAVRELSDVLVGQTFEGVEVTWQRLYHVWRWRGGSVANTALSALDLACWDLEGKKLGVPVYRLLGGALRRDIPAYSSHWLSDSHDPDEARRRARATVEAGYGGLKWGLPSIWDNRDVPSSIDLAVDIIAAARGGGGPKCQIYIDCAECLTTESARRLSRALEPYDIGWFEEPLPFENVAAMVRLRRDLGMPIATGERLLSRWEFRGLIEQEGALVIQPDVMHAGGLTEVRKIANAAETYYLPVAPHNPAGPISTAAAIHLGAAIPNFLVLETMDGERAARDGICVTPLGFDGGVFAVPEGPGLGVELDLQRLRAMSYRPQPVGTAPRLWLG